MPCALISRTMSKIRSTKIGASPIDGSSSISSFGLAISARPIATICCSPPESVPACCDLRSARRGKERVDTLEVALHLLVAARALERAHLQVLEHAHPREEPPPLGRLRDPELHDLVRGPIRDLLALEADRSPPRAVEAVDRAERRRLAGAVRADQRDDLALPDVDRDALERFDRAVVGVDVLELEDELAGSAHAVAALPRYASITRSSFCTSFGAPSAIFSP